MGTVGPVATITSGVQDIAALLPLLGTEQCEDHIGSSLTKGYLYAATTPLSIFGSLGMARAGLKTLVASFVIPKCNIVGAQILADMGFKPQGKNLSLIMAVEGDTKHRYLLERRLDTLLEELHVDSSREIKVDYDCTTWHAKMMIVTFISCSVSVTPYIYINVKGDLKDLDLVARWMFPVVRALGGFLTATMTQLVIQTRIVTLSKMWLTRTRRKHTDGDVEKGPEDASDRNSLFVWCLSGFLFIGVVAVVIGYIGCFSIVQSAQTSSGTVTGPIISWLGLEAGLSLIRMIFWAANPKYDDAPTLGLVLTLEGHVPLPTCMKSGDEIIKEKVLPVTRASEFLKSMTSCVGVIEYFSHPDLALYYTLTRKDLPASLETPTERILYITIFDHKERTAKVYTQQDSRDTFYSTESGLIIDPKHDQLETILVEESQPNQAPVAVDAYVQSMLANHYRSIMDGISFRARATYRICNKWTLQAKDNVNEPAHNTNRNEKINNTSDVELQFLEQGQLERMRRSLVVTRGQWVEDYMAWVIGDAKNVGEDLPLYPINSMLPTETNDHDTSQSENNSSVLRDEMDNDSAKSGLGKVKVKDEDENEDEDEDVDQVEILFVNERYYMEKLLVEEVRRWETQLLLKTQDLFNRLDGIQEEKQLVSMWTSNCWRRLVGEITAVDARMIAAKKQRKGHQEVWDTVHKDILSAWGNVVKDYVGTLGSSSLPLPPQPSQTLVDQLYEGLDNVEKVEIVAFGYLGEWYKGRCRRWQEERALRLQREVEDIERRLSRGLEHCNQFSSTPELVGWKHSRCAWRILSDEDLKLNILSVPSNVMHIRCLNFDEEAVKWVFNMIKDMPWVTSICFLNSNEGVTLSSNVEDHHLLSIEGNIRMSPEVDKVLNCNKTRLEQTFISLSPGTRMKFIPENHQLIYPDISQSQLATISFFGPTQGIIVFRLIHCLRLANWPGAAMTIDTPMLRITNNEVSFEFKVPLESSWMIHDILLHPMPADSDPSIFSFTPGVRNIFTLTLSGGPGLFYHYLVRDIQLLHTS